MSVVSSFGYFQSCCDCDVVELVVHAVIEKCEKWCLSNAGHPSHYGRMNQKIKSLMAPLREGREGMMRDLGAVTHILL